jgi:hypothetical protein
MGASERMSAAAVPELSNLTAVSGGHLSRNQGIQEGNHQMSDTKIHPVSLSIVLAILQIFIGIGAVAGGLAMISDPSGALLEMPLEMLEHTPFGSFLVPGIVLLVVNGLGSLVGTVFSLLRHRYAGVIAILLGGFLILWIVVQVVLIRGFHWLHALYLALGVAELVLGWLLHRSVIETLRH